MFWKINIWYNWVTCLGFLAAPSLTNHTMYNQKQLKCNNLWNDKLGRWFVCPSKPLTKRLIFQALFFSQFLIDLGHSKLSIFITKKFECPKSIRSYEKNDVWNFRRLDGGSLGQTNHRPSVKFYKLSDFFWGQTTSKHEMTKILNKNL